MITSTQSALQTARSMDATSSFTLNTPTDSASTSSFAQQLAAALESYLGANNNPANFQLNIQTVGGQSSGDRQFLVTVTSPNSATSTGTGTGTSPSTSATATTPTLMNLSGSPAVQTTSTPSAASTSAGGTQASQPKTEQDAYWAMQPAAVQALRNISDPTARGEMAQQLANEGYAIDVPIMVWGWDPLITMTIRQNSGYTWVPSANQGALPTAPNCALPGLPAYDPNHPPAGSIMVSTAFAQGLESTAPWNMNG